MLSSRADRGSEDTTGVGRGRGGSSGGGRRLRPPAAAAAPPPGASRPPPLLVRSPVEVLEVSAPSTMPAGCRLALLWLAPGWPTPTSCDPTSSAGPCSECLRTLGRRLPAALAPALAPGACISRTSCTRLLHSSFSPLRCARCGTDGSAPDFGGLGIGTSCSKGPPFGADSLLALGACAAVKPPAVRVGRQVLSVGSPYRKVRLIRRFA
mmetsp:Transcript_21789/g.74046  ORF Transcript_21789/g.74046 Transcript_21789/m.74046 type:complete len:209 (+) Transcript_21789:966-1592(+)